MLEQAGLNIKDPQSDEDTKFLINYYLSGKNIDREPDNWGERLEEIKKKLDWDPDERPFAKVAAQNCSHMILQVTLLKQSSNTPQKLTNHYPITPRILNHSLNTPQTLLEHSPNTHQTLIQHSYTLVTLLWYFGNASVTRLKHFVTLN